MTGVEVAGDLYLLLAALGLALAVDYAGIPFLGQSAFVAVGGFGTVLLATHGIPLLAAVALAVVIAAVAGFVLASGAARLYGAPLALATWGLAWLAQSILDAFPRISGGSQGLTLHTPVRLVSPTLGVTVTLSTTVHLVVAACLCALTLLALHRLDRGPIGLDLAAIRNGPTLAPTLGVRVGARRRGVVAATAALGALGGAGSAVLLGTIAPSDVSPLLAVELLVAVLLGAGWRPWGTVVGFVVIAAMPHAAGHIASAADLPEQRVAGVITAVLLVVALLARGRVSSVIQRFIRGERLAEVDPTRVPLHPEVAMGAPVVEARGLRLTFGAVSALDGVDLDIRAGEVHALIGPNGSGKSTALRVLAGALVPDAGKVLVAGSAVAARQADRVAAGVVRTPQRTLLAAGLSTGEQVAVGALAAAPVAGAGLRHLLATPSSVPATADRDGRAAGALDLLGLSPSRSLDSGDERLLQVARAAATGARALLLDEPAAGTTPAERDRLAGAIRTLAEAGAAVCVVEHDMRFVAAVADRVTVLDAGRVLTTGPPADVRNDPRVRRVYLGSEEG